MNGIISLLTQINQMVATLGDNTGLLSSPETWNPALAAYANGISEVVIKPVAYTIFTLFLMLELYHLGQRLSSMGGSQQIVLQQVGLMFVKVLLCKWAIDNSLFLVSGIVEIFQQITAGISSFIGTGYVDAQLDIDALVATVPTDFLSRLQTQVILLIPYAIIWLVKTLLSAIVVARFVELYVMMAIAPLPLSTFCSHELHNIAVNYCKNVAAVGLQGALIYIVIGFSSALTASVFSPNTESLVAAAWGLATASVVIFFAVFTCGKWARSYLNAM